MISKTNFTLLHQEKRSFNLFKDNFNVAIHVRRGDIMTDSNNPNLVMRYLSNDYLKRC